jgi:hypothetical protein
MDQDFPTTFEEDELKEFAQAHWQFFFTDPLAETPRRAFVDVLWPAIDRYLEIWRKTKAENYWAAGEEMVKGLHAAKIKAPDWPPGPKKIERSQGNPPAAPRADDEDIPF